MELFLDVLGESLVDTAKMLPFLFLAYLFIAVSYTHLTLPTILRV